MFKVIDDYYQIICWKWVRRIFRFCKIYILIICFLLLIPMVYATTGETWNLATANAPFEGRSSHATLSFDNKMWIIGGGSDKGKYNDTWSSSDGVSWAKVTSKAPWTARFSFASGVFDNKMWILGGYDGTYKNDVWYSSDGITWTQATQNAAWSKRQGLAGLVYKNKLWILGGSNATHADMCDVWYSSDGITWTQATKTASWFGANLLPATVFDNKMWVVGITGSPSGNKNTVWYSTDGISWTKTTSSASFSGPTGKYEFPFSSFDNKLWVIGGWNGTTAFNDVWSSSDGVTWDLISDAAPWDVRTGQSLVSYNSRLWAIGGNGRTYVDGTIGRNDIWYTSNTVVAPVASFTGTPTSGTSPLTVTFTDNSANGPTSWTWSFGDGDTTNSTKQNPIHKYNSAGTYTVSLTVINTVGSDTETRTNYITVSSPTTSILNPPVLGSPGSAQSPGDAIPTLTPQFTWQGIPGADQYGLYIRDLDSNTIVFDSRLKGVTVTGTSYTLPTGILENGKSYRWNMNTHSSAGWGSYSDRLYFRAPSPITLPAPPALDSPGNSGSSDSIIPTLFPTFKWTQVPGADKYELSITEITNGEGSADEIFNSEKRGETITGSNYPLPPKFDILQNGKKYRWNMRTHSSAGWGSYSQSLFFQSPSIKQAQIPVAGFIISPISPKTYEDITLDASTSMSPDGNKIVEYIWKISDRPIVTTTTDNYSFKAFNEGTYDITLIVKDEKNQKSNTVKKTINIINSDDSDLKVLFITPDKMCNWQEKEFEIDIFNYGDTNTGKLYVKLDLHPYLRIISQNEPEWNYYYDDNSGLLQEDLEIENKHAYWTIEDIPGKGYKKIKFTVKTDVDNILAFSKPMDCKVTIKKQSELPNVFFPGIGWKPWYSESPQGESEKNRIAKGVDLDSITMKSYYETQDDTKVPPKLAIANNFIDINGALHVWFASHDVYTDENFLTNADPPGYHKIVFSHSGGTQTLYKKLERGDFTAKYAFFIAPALLNEKNLTKLIQDKKVQKIFIVQSKDDILYNVQLTFEKQHEFYGSTQPGLTPHIQKVKDPKIFIPWVTIGAGELFPNGKDYGVNGKDFKKLPSTETFWIGGANRATQSEFTNIDVDNDGQYEIITLNPSSQSFSDEFPFKYYAIKKSVDLLVKNDILQIVLDGLDNLAEDILQQSYVHGDLLDWTIEHYNNGDVYPFNGSISELQKIQVPASQIAIRTIGHTIAHDPNEKTGPEGHHPADEPLNYRVEYENEGEGTAYGVYITDVLDSGLDNSTLEIGPVYSVATGLAIAEPGIYFPENHTIFWDIGEVLPGEGGYSNISVKFSPTIPDGTKVVNYATVYFPSAFEETQTNSIVTIKGENLPPDAPSLTYPESNATDLPINGTLFWECDEPNNETLLYDIYLGTSTPPTLILENATSDLYSYSNLDRATTYYWKVDAKDPYGAMKSSEIHKFTIVPEETLPGPDFSADVKYGTIPMVVTFTDLSTNTPTSWNWSFGDGNFSESQNPVHTYVYSGTFMISLTATNGEGSRTKREPKFITVAAVSENTNMTFNGVRYPRNTGQQEIVINLSSISGQTTVGRNSIILTNPGAGWTDMRVFGANISNSSGDVHITDISDVVLNSAPVTATLNQTTLGTVSTSISIVLDQMVSGVTLEQNIVEGSNNSVTNAFQLAAANDGLNVDNVAYTLEIKNTEQINANLSSSGAFVPVTLNFSVSHAWVVANGGRDKIKIIRSAEDGTKQVLTTRFLFNDAVMNMDYFGGDSPDGLSIFGVAAVSPAEQSTAQTSISSSNGGDSPSLVSSAQQSKSQLAPPDPASGPWSTFQMTGQTHISQISVQTIRTIKDLIVVSEKVNSLPQGLPYPGVRVYEYQKIEVYHATDDDINQGTIEFTVSESWLVEQKMSFRDVQLLRYHDKVWEKLPTEYVGKKDGQFMFKATTEGFSYFATALIKDATIVKETTPHPTESLPASTRTISTESTAQPAVSLTMAAPMETEAEVPKEKGSPVPIFVIGIVGIIILCVSGFIAKAWWTRRQNPALFRDEPYFRWKK